MNAKGHFILFLSIILTQIFVLWVYKPSIELKLIFVMLGILLSVMLSICFTIISNFNEIMNFLVRFEEQNRKNIFSNEEFIIKQTNSIEKTLKNIDWKQTETNHNFKLILEDTKKIIDIFENTRDDQIKQLIENIVRYEGEINWKLKYISEDLNKIVRLGDIIVDNKKLP